MARLWRLVVSLALLGTLALPARAAAPAMPSARVAAFTQLLATTPNPSRDLLALAERLKLHSTTPIDPIVNLHPTDYPVGRVDHFYVSTGSGESLIAARLAYKTAHAYFYVQSGIKLGLQSLARSAATFEQHIYPTDIAAFGPAWIPGVDNDTHITILNCLLQGGGAIGYVSLEDLFPHAASPFSNQRKILYLDLGALQPGTASYDSTVAHEFQHVLHAHLHPMDEAWINEGSSVLAQVLNRYGATGWDAGKAQQPDAQLDVWDPNSSIGYGNGFMWMLYYYEHFGGDRATRLELADNRLSGMQLFSDLLSKLGSHETADQMFADWVVANFVNDPAIDGGRYGYRHTQVRAISTSTQTVRFSLTSSMHQYAANYVDIPRTDGKALTLSFAGQPTVPLLSTVPPGPAFWWSNRGDSVDDTLTSPMLDLRHVAHPVLQYQIWYELEKDYDYGYVEVSTDGGKTWQAQRTPYTTNSDPNGANLGNGYTGSSCNRASAAQHCWLDEHVDLSAYVGKQIKLRFEQVTDDELNLQGVAIAHVQIPQIGFDGVAAGTAWQTSGWVNAINTLAEQWVVQAIVYGPGRISVEPMMVGADGQGSLRIPAGSKRVVMAVSPLAPLTTVSAAYTLRAGA